VSFESLAQLVVAHGYLVISTAIALECAALPIPGELLLLTFGGLSAQGRLDPALGIAVAALGVIVGDSVAYWGGRLGGQRVLERMRFGSCWSPGTATIVFGRFVIGARVMVAPLAGASRRPFIQFLAIDTIGALIWSALFVLGGYAAGANVAVLQRHFTSVVTAIQIVVAVAIAAYALSRLLRHARMPVAVGVALLALAAIRSASPLDEPALRARGDGAGFARPWSEDGLLTPLIRPR
jgi:membrane protein DedA with SNARE-associated domain